MKNPRLLSLSISIGLLGVAAEARAQSVVCSLGPVMPNYTPLADQAPTTRAARDLKKLQVLLCPKGCGHVGLFQNPTTPNAVTLSAGNGDSRIEYSPTFLDKVQEVFGPDARFGVLAHEFGHHVDANSTPTAWMNTSWDSEVRADAWAGCALARAGMKTQGLKDTLRAVAGSPSNPSKSDTTAWEQRSQALQRGFDGCSAGAGGMKAAAFDSQFKGTGFATGGCSSNADCKMGRVCMDGRCDRRLSSGVCLKDVDCPDSQICTALGKCDNPAGSGQFVSASTLTSQPKVKAPACNAQCGLERRQCRVGAAKSLNECLRGIVANAAYKDCACPKWPSAKPECRQICETAFEKVDECESDYAPKKEACLGEAVACRDCQPR